MKICMFTNTYLPHVGGVARSVHAFSRNLERMGHRVLIIAPEYEQEGDDPSDEAGVLRLPAIQNFNGSDFSLRLPAPFIIDDALDVFRPDIIHSHHPYLLGDAALRIARERGLPLAFTHHTLYENYTHYVPLDSKSLRRFVINLSTEYANLCTRVIAPSRSVADLIAERGVVRPIREIPTGVDIKFFSSGKRASIRGEFGLTEDDVVLGHLGRLAPEKNLEYLAEAAALCLEQNNRARFLVVGDGSSRSDIIQTFESRNLAERLIMAGKKTGPDLADAYAAMDLFLFASHSETQGMVLAEAMAAGLPVVALDASGAREVVRDKVNGRLLRSEAPPREFADAVLDLLSSPERMNESNRSARKTAENFSEETCAQKLADLYVSAQEEYRREHKGRPYDDQPWNAILERLKVEWDLITEKTSAVVEALTAEEGESSRK